MKLLNYDARTLIMQNMRSVAGETSTNYTHSQYKTLCKLIIQKRISKQFFEVLLLELYGLNDWKQLDYGQMYETIHILTYLNYKKVRM